MCVAFGFSSFFLYFLVPLYIYIFSSCSSSSMQVPVRLSRRCVWSVWSSCHDIYANLHMCVVFGFSSFFLYFLYIYTFSSCSSSYMQVPVWLSRRRVWSVWPSCYDILHHEEAGQTKHQKHWHSAHSLLVPVQSAKQAVLRHIQFRCRLKVCASVCMSACVCVCVCVCVC